MAPLIIVEEITCDYIISIVLTAISEKRTISDSELEVPKLLKNQAF